MDMMTNPQGLENVPPIDRTIALTEAALEHCDKHGFVYAAIDISSALDKLKDIKAGLAE